MPAFGPELPLEPREFDKDELFRNLLLTKRK